MDEWVGEDGERTALKIQANRIGMLPHRVAMIQLATSQASTKGLPQERNPQPASQPPSESDNYPDPDEP